MKKQRFDGNVWVFLILRVIPACTYIMHLLNIVVFYGSDADDFLSRVSISAMQQCL